MASTRCTCQSPSWEGRYFSARRRSRYRSLRVAQARSRASSPGETPAGDDCQKTCSVPTAMSGGVADREVFGFGVVQHDGGGAVLGVQVVAQAKRQADGRFGVEQRQDFLLLLEV